MPWRNNSTDGKKNFELHNEIILTHCKKMDPEEMCQHLVEDSGPCLDLYLKKTSSDAVDCL